MVTQVTPEIREAIDCFCSGWLENGMRHWMLSSVGTPSILSIKVYLMPSGR
ncbi:hypothetical protein BH20CHL1_BH20CHL1_09390 [soil metagenome]